MLIVEKSLRTESGNSLLYADTSCMWLGGPYMYTKFEYNWLRIRSLMAKKLSVQPAKFGFLQFARFLWASPPTYPQDRAFLYS